MRVLAVGLLLVGAGVFTALVTPERSSQGAEGSVRVSQEGISPVQLAKPEKLGAAAPEGPTPDGSSLEVVAPRAGKPVSERTPVAFEPAPGLVPAKRPRQAPPTGSRKGPWITRKGRERLAEELSHPELVENLRDDDVRWNATAAGRELSRRLRDPLQSGEARLHLERALFSDDGQEKRIAVGLLQSLALDSNPALEPYTPPEVLLDYTANQLQGWDCWTQPAWIPGDTHDRKSVDFAFAHIDRMEQRLVEKLASRPPEERFIFAFILGCSERRHLVDQIAPVLIDHLRDNYIRADALMSMQALYALGDVTLPWLQGGVSGADAQQRDCLELLVLELVDPALTPEQRAERARLNRVTRKCDDPVQCWRYRQYRSD